MKKSLDSFSRSFAKRAISLLKNHTFPQIWNTAKFEMSKLRGFNATYLKYEPFRLILFITFKCNLSCSWCALRSPNLPSEILKTDEMQMDAFKYVVNKFDHALWLELSGGEPFLHSHIFEMIDYAHEHKMKICIPTNGIVMHEMLDRVVCSPLSLLNISLNACNSDEFARHGGSEQVYNRLLEDIPKLVKIRNRCNKDLEIIISYVCTKANYKSIPKMAELAEDLGVDGITFRNLIPYGIPGFLQDQCLYVDDSEVVEVIKSVPSPKSNLEVVMPRLYKREYPDRRCDGPFRILTIDAKGDISPCCLIPPRRSYGNVFTDKDVWNNSAFQRTRELFTNQSLSLPDFCKTCPGLVAEWRPDYIPHRRGIR